jgi:hypothetical protein
LHLIEKTFSASCLGVANSNLHFLGLFIYFLLLKGRPKSLSLYMSLDAVYKSLLQTVSTHLYNGVGTVRYLVFYFS